MGIFSSVLIGRANQWLYSTHGIRVRRCESVLGMAARSHGYNPSRAIGTVSKINSDYTYNMRFLRYNCYAKSKIKILVNQKLN